MEKLTKEQKLYVDLKKTAVTTSQGLKDIFYKVPKIFWLGELYKDMSLEAKIAYGILEDRKNVSLKNKWYDNENKIYFIYTIEDLQKELGVARATAVKIKKELISYGLLSQTKSEPNKPARLYLYNPVATEEDEKKYVLRYATGQNTTEEMGTETPSKKTDSDEFTNSKQEKDEVENGSSNFELPEVQNLNHSKTNVSNINNYISNDSYDSELRFDKRLLNYKGQGVPDRITQILTIGKNNYKDCAERIGLLFKAKSSVSKELYTQGLDGLILFEDFTEEDWDGLYNVIHLCFVKIKEGLIKNEEKYIFASLKTFFENYKNSQLYTQRKSMEG